jgi:inorganic triphosphatase YgiF
VTASGSSAPLEREVKLQVGEDFALPDLDGVAGLRAADRGVHVLEATYWDTDAMDLVRLGYGMRYRTTDGAAGTWTVKGNTTSDGPALVREETDIAGEPDPPPGAALRLIVGDVDASRLGPVAWLRTQRHIVDLLDGGGAQWAEVADDRVAVLDGNRVVTTFREVEVELKGTPDERRLAAVIERLREAGAEQPAATSKYMRALRALGRALPA